MPAAAPIVLGAAFSSVSFTAAAGFAFSWATFGGSLVLGAISHGLTPKAKKPGIDTSAVVNKGQTIAVRQPDLTRQEVYGHTRITRGYAHMESTGINGALHQILMLCEGPIRAINEIWINDYCIPPDWIDADGNVTQGRYAGNLIIRKHLGTETQAADSVASANIPGWTTDHRLQGIAYLYVIMYKNQDVYPTGVPNITAIVEGKELYDPRVDTDLFSTNMALFANDYLLNERYGFGAFDDDIDAVNIAAQANICDEIVDVNGTDVAVTAVATSTDIITLDGVMLPYQFGDRVQISSTGTVPGGLSDATNYYVIPYQVKDTPRMLLATSLANAMAKVAVDITSAGTGTIAVNKTGEPRYHGSGIVDSDSTLSQALSEMSVGMAGRAVNIGGFWTLQAGAWRTPELTVTLSDIRGSIGIKNALSMSDSYNVVKGVYQSSETVYQSSDYTPATYTEFVSQDNGIESIKDLNLAFTNRITTAQRIAKIELFRGRQDIVFNSDFSTRLLQTKPGDNLDLTLEKYGWDEKEFEITQFSFDNNDGSMVIRLTLRETAQEIFDWSAGEAVFFDPAPNTNLPNPFIVLVPTGVSFNSREIGTRDGDVIFALTLDWDLHPDQFVTQFGAYEIEYKLSSEADTAWRPAGPPVTGSQIETDVINSSAGVEYDLRIRARNNLGVRSNWVTILGAVVGSSGGVGTTLDYEGVADSVGTSLDYGSVADAPTSFEDWEYVA